MNYTEGTRSVEKETSSFVDGGKERKKQGGPEKIQTRPRPSWGRKSSLKERREAVGGETASLGYALRG